MSERAKAVCAAAVTGALVGAAMVSTRAVSNDVSAETLAFLRYAIGAVVLVAPMLRRWSVRFTAKDFCAVAGLGILQFAMLILLLNYALARLPAATCALVFSTLPLVTLCLAIATGRERFSWTRLIGAGVAVSGIALLLQPSAAAVGGAADGWAWAALLGATFIGAACSLLYRPYLQRYPAMYVSVVAMFVSVLFLAGVCLARGAPLLPSMSGFQWANVVFIGLSSAVGYFCLLWALSRLEASRVMSFQALAPITAVLIELLNGSYPLTWRLTGAFVLVLSGVWFGTHERRAAA
ncbi:DMT family transporter [Achromobacter pestifer]|uniref:DMT family transporter n=1 Tax=Achromobacter pestifer TaxID=1353889 RepID=A0A7D4I3S9_9BURK|nr:DMT family transporter [Achromobacter pestifer]QKH38296.1 DMT family transporter [Achromobacter pestifer]